MKSAASASVNRKTYFDRIGMQRMISAVAIAGLGILGICAGLYSLIQTAKAGRARLRGGRQVSLTRNPALYWINFAGLCLMVAMSAGLLYVGIFHLL
jgi:hypothetical protein